MNTFLSSDAKEEAFIKDAMDKGYVLVEDGHYVVDLLKMWMNPFIHLLVRNKYAEIRIDIGYKYFVNDGWKGLEDMAKVIGAKIYIEDVHRARIDGIKKDLARDLVIEVVKWVKENREIGKGWKE